MVKFSLIVLFIFITASYANAALLDIGTATYGGNDYNLIYDTDDQLTWLDYSQGFLGYGPTVDWAASLNDPGELTINLDPGYIALWGAEQWRLPQISGWWTNSSVHQFYFDTSEMYGLYYDELGNVLNDPSINLGPFQNIIAGVWRQSFYWIEPTFDTGVTYKPAMDWDDGSLWGTMTVSTNGGTYGMAVISGAVVVPEPTSIVLLAIGGLLVRRRK